MKPKSHDRMFLTIGGGLILVAFVAMNARPFARGDMRVFDWVAANAILTAVGLALVIGVGIAKLRRRFRRST